MNRNDKTLTTALLIVLIVSSFSVYAQNDALKQKIQAKLDSFRLAGKFPGLTLGVALPDNTILAFASGSADSTKHIPMTTGSYLMEGSVGKTYVSAVTMQLIAEGKFSLDDKVSKYLGHYDWYGRMPNAQDITIKMLMNHTSGIMRYEFKPAFTKDLTNNPDKVWKPEELLAYVLDEKPSFKAGEGWEYSDTNYIVLAMIIEQVTGKKYYDLMKERILKPLHLTQTKPSDHRKLPGLVQGYAGIKNDFGGKSEVIGDDGKFIINPQFEWTGGGIYCTSRDLARWAKLLYEGKACDPSMLPLMETGTAAKMLGQNTEYGLGVIIHHSDKYGTFIGHSGFFPGYLTEMYYFPQYKMAFAVQTNTSDFSNKKISPLKILVEIAKTTYEESRKAN
ncbi:MAG: beta-lactamase family protein [Bacteroidetes bacterium]|nr:beta-lactamase family protein [Bacteroidota bacterium]